MIRCVHPTPDWVSRFSEALVATYVQEANILVQMGETAAVGFAARQQMISAAGEAVRQMQLETFEQRQAAMVHDTRHWVAALAGEELVRDPDTGKVYAVPCGYRTYYIDDNPLDPTILAGNDMSRGTPPGPGDSACSSLRARCHELTRADDLCILARGPHRKTGHLRYPVNGTGDSGELSCKR